MKLIVNADDFGYSKGVNLGVVEAHQHGIVSSATMMVNMTGLEHAVRLAREHPTLGIGIHLVLTCGKPVHLQVPSLTTEDGRFPTCQELFSTARTDEVEQEFTAQIERFLATGLTPTHLDSHHHVHAHEAILPVVLRLAERYKLPVRNWALHQDQAIVDSRILTTERFSAQFYGDDLSVEGLCNLLVSLEGCQTAEIMCHPAYLDEELLTGSSYARQRARELQILTDSSVREFLRLREIELATFNEIG